MNILGKVKASVRGIFLKIHFSRKGEVK